MSNPDIQAAFAEEARQRQKPKSDPKVLLVAIIKERPDTAESSHISAAIRLAQMPGYEDYLEEALRRVFRMDYPAAKQLAFPPTKKTSAARRASQGRAARKVQISLTADRTAGKIIAGFLETMMISGKPLGECTSSDLRKEGGILAEIAKRLKPGQTVRDVLTNEDIAAIIKARKA